MITEVVMPQMGADMKEGTILRWLKAEGDQVDRGEIIAEIETDKANVEIEAFGGGVFRKVIHREGDVIPVGTVMAVIAAPGDDITKYAGGAAAAAASPPAAEAPSAPAQPPAASQPAAPAPAPAPATPSAPVAEGERQRVSPVARRIAEERGVDLRGIQGSGPDGRIVRRDVESAPAGAPVAASPATASPASAPPPRPRPVSGPDSTVDVPVTRLRETIARRMVQSKQEAPHYYLQAQIDMTQSVEFQERANASLGEAGRISVNDVIILATARALVEHPSFNAWWVENHLQTHTQVNIGVAVPIEGGLVVPALIDCANKGLQDISLGVRDMVTRARSGRLRPEEYAAGTFSISNLGGPQFGIDVLVAIINPPQVGVLGVGSMKDTPVVRDGEIVIRPMMNLVLSADHRATDGADGARFLQSIRRYLESPTLLLV